MVYAEMMADEIEGRRRSEVLAARPGDWAGRIAAVNSGSWRGRAGDEIDATGYVAHRVSRGASASVRPSRVARS